MANIDYRKDATMQARPRSVYTAHSYNQEESNMSAFQDYSKFLEGGLGQAEIVANAAWQHPWHAPLQRKPLFYPGDEVYHVNTWRGLEATTMPGGAGYKTTVTPHGTISLRLRNHVNVEMTIDGAVRLINVKKNIVLAMSRSGASAALIHPNGRVYHYGSQVEIQAQDQQGNKKYAKMWYKGVSFTAEQCALVYLVDTAGTRTTTDTFLDMTQDFTLNVFYNESRYGPFYVNEAMLLLQASQYWLTDDGIENWIINNVRISQTADGLVRIHRCSHKYQLRTSPTNGSASITSPFLHCTGSLGQTRHLFVRRGERRMHFDGKSFIVRNAGHSAGFDNRNRLRVY